MMNILTFIRRWYRNRRLRYYGICPTHLVKLTRIPNMYGDRWASCVECERDSAESYDQLRNELIRKGRKK